MDNTIDIQTEQKKDKGFTLVELLIVIVILGILATVTVFAVRGITDQGKTSACNTDKVTLQTAVETFFANYTGLSNQIPTGALAANAAYTGSPAIAAVAKPASVTFPITNSAGASPAATLVNAGLLRAVPTNYFVNVDGTLVIANAQCGTVGTNIG
ncbi:MAG: prepilin-type N-terminal cleavage/methylation domain-containing protein [Acidimicrobiales bacterium]